VVLLVAVVLLLFLLLLLLAVVVVVVVVVVVAVATWTAQPLRLPCTRASPPSATLPGAESESTGQRHTRTRMRRRR
jgi:hypothetical protein